MTARILVARLDNMGDVLVSGPAVRAIAAKGEVWLLCGPGGASAARMLPGVHRVLVWDCPWIGNPPPAATAQRMAELQALVEECSPNEAVILTSFHQSPLPLALQLRLARVPRIIGASVDYAGSLLDVRLRPGEDFAEDQPEPLRALAIAEAAGFPRPRKEDDRPSVVVTADIGSLIGPLVGTAPYIAVHPGASVPSRRWPAERYRDVVRMLVSLGWAVVVTGNDDEQDLTAHVAGDHGVDLGGRTDVEHLAGVLRSASALIAGNTGPAHLAAAVGTPVVSLYSPVISSVRWAPHGVPVALLGDQKAACRDTRARECPVDGHPCLTSVTAADVVLACAGLAGMHPPGWSKRKRQLGVPA